MTTDTDTDTDTETYAVLDLFCGLGGFSAAFADSDRWDVTTVDIEPGFDPDICADVMDLRPSGFGTDFDVIVASPPCPEFSPAQNLNGEHDPDGDAITLVYHTLGLTRGLKPRYWFVENPRGQLRSYIGAPTCTVTYCQYGEDRMKPTDLWGIHPGGFTGRRCDYGGGCHISNRAGSNPHRDQLGFETAAERSRVPRNLSASIRDACEAALDGDAPEQTTVTNYTP